MHSTRQPTDLTGCWRGVLRAVCSLGDFPGAFPPEGAGLDALKGAGLGSAEGVAPWADSTWKLQWKSLTPFSPAEGA